MPHVGKDNLVNLIKYHEENNLSMTILSSIFDNPFSYGRIVRENNSVIGIIEEKEATEEQKLI